MKLKKLIWKGEKFVLVNGDGNEREGAIATVEEFESFSMNRYHLMNDGRIMSFGEQVGHVDEIKWLEEEYE